jgi:tagatose-1,6-bisphosphate aldolase non-catalytic subunit AgaZ/GatZ
MPTKKPNFLDEIVIAQKNGEARGITSICSAHPWVLKAAMIKTLKVSRTFRVLLIESTCNQVNQFGGYTGLTPADQDPGRTSRQTAPCIKPPTC